ncbi:UNVERIFIED_CONTAM: hypothetical protein FKN15_012128 [Acipenser sinensis]
MDRKGLITLTLFNGFARQFGCVVPWVRSLEVDHFVLLGYVDSEMDFYPNFFPNLESPIVCIDPGPPLQPPCRLAKRRQTYASSETVLAKAVSFFALQVHSDATSPIVLEDRTDLNGSTADPQANRITWILHFTRSTFTGCAPLGSPCS